MNKHYLTIVLSLLLLPLALGQVQVWQGYEDKSLYAQTDYPTNTAYEWNINGELVQGVASTTFLTHFDGTSTTSEGETGTILSENYEPTLLAQGLRGIISYQTANNLPLDEGTVEMWFTLLEPANSQVFNSSAGGYPYLFKHVNTELGQSFYFFIKQSVSSPGWVSHTGNWTKAVQIYLNQYSIEVGEAHHIAYSYSHTNNISALYLDGFIIGQNRYDYEFTPVSEFQIGNEHAIIDEVRIQQRALSAKEILDNYQHGQAYSNNDIQLEHTAQAGNSVSLNIGADSGTTTVQQAKFTVTPDEYLLAANYPLTISASGTNCRYSTMPKPYDQLEGNGNTVSILSPSIDYLPVYFKCGNDDYSFYRRYRIRPQELHTYPKTASLWFGNSIAESEINYLAQFDLLTISPSNMKLPLYLHSIREINPDIIITYYSNTQAPKPDYGVQLYDMYNMPLIDDWRLKDADGNFVPNIYFPPAIYNIYVGNTGFHETYAQWMEEMYIARGMFDGIWFDNYNDQFWWLHESPTSYLPVDFNNDGINEDLNDPAVMAYSQQLWNDGLIYFSQQVLQKIGRNALYIGNNANKAHATDFLHGKLWEGSFKLHTFEYLINPTSEGSFAYWQAHSQSPQMNMNIHYEYPYNTESWKRYGLAMSLFFDLYHYATVNNDHYREIHWMDEYWVNFETGEASTDSADRGYLGQANGEYYEVQTGVYRRDFEQGIVLLNNNPTIVNVPLEEQYRYIHGTTDPEANPGGTTANSITLGVRDARILLTENTSPITNWFYIIMNYYGQEHEDLTGDGVITLLDLIMYGRNYT